MKWVPREPTQKNEDDEDVEVEPLLTHPQYTHNSLTLVHGQ